MIPALVIPALMAAFSPSTWIASPTPQSQRGAEERRAEPRAEPKVLIIGIDGVRPDALQAAETPAIDTLIANGCVAYDASTSAYTVSGPGWSTILCGVWPDKHRSVDNRFLITDYERYPSLFTLAKRAQPAIRTAYFGNWGPIGERILAKDPIDVRVSLQDTKNDAPQTEACVKALAKDEALDLAVFYVGNVDETGHAVGFHRAVPGYLSAIEAADALVGRVLAAVESRANREREDWLVILTTDHGGTIDLNHGRDIVEHREVPFIVSGDAAAKGPLRTTVNQCDVVATAFAHLGIAVDPAWDLDSCAVGLATVRSAADLYGRNLVMNGDAEFASPAGKPEGNRGVPGWRDWGAASVLAYGAHADFPADTAADRGRNFFFGGNAGESRLVQRIDLGAAARDIDAATVPFEIGAWLGGFGPQRDVAWIDLRWIDERGGTVGEASLEAVTLEERTRAFADAGGGPDARPDPDADTGANAALTGFLERRTGGVVPAGARMAEITVRFERSEGLCDGYADNISLVLRPAAVVMDAGPAVFVHGEDRATVWMRAGVSAAVPADSAILRCTMRDESGEELVVEARPDAERDATVHFAFTGLAAGTDYRYVITRAADGVELARGGFTQLSTDARRTRLAFGSCADIDESTARTWRQIGRESPDALVLIGDTPYIDTTDLAVQRARYRLFDGAPDFERLTASMPLFATWDDHDFGKNDTDGRLPGRENSRRAFLEYRPIDPAGDGAGGLYTSFRSGPVEVFIVDTRWFAKTEPAPERADLPSLLGEAQWAWLAKGLRESTAPCKVVASSMVWNNRVRPLKGDCWGAYPHEFERFQRIVRESKATGVVLVSGDVHRSRVLVHPTRDAVGYDLVEFVTSPLHARVHSDAAVTGPEVVFDRGVASSFLLLEARESGAGGSLTARFVSATGETFHTHTVDVGALVPRE